MQLADTYAAAQRPAASYTGNIMEVIYAVNCLDKPDTADLARLPDRRARTSPRRRRPGGRSWRGAPCRAGSGRSGATGQAREGSAQGSGPIVVVGTTRDPATPYEWSVRLHDQLANSSLITFDGDGHTAYTRSNTCVDDAIDAYYVKKAACPATGCKC